MSELLSYFENRRQLMIERLTLAIEHESFTEDKPGVDRFATLLSDWLHAAGAELERQPREEVGDILLARWNTDAPGEPLLLLSHMDTVWVPGTLADRPVRIEDDGRLYGPGAVDMKGGIIVALDAIEGLREMGKLPDRPIWYLLTSDEEAGSKYSQQIIEETARKSALVLVTEPPNRDGSLKTWRKGVATYRLIVRGRASHAGNEPERGINAIIELAQQALAINELNDLKYGTSASVTLAKGGSASNVIPDYAEATIDTRMMTQAAHQRLRETMLNLVPHIPGAEVEVIPNHYRPPMERMDGVFERARDIASAEGITIREDGAGGGSDGNFTAAMGIPTLDGLGAEGEGLHALHEHVLVNSLSRRAALMAALLRDW